MAEFCLACWNELNETEDPPQRYVFSEELQLCEGCGEWKHTIVMKRKRYPIAKLKAFFSKVQK